MYELWEKVSIQLADIGGSVQTIFTVLAVGVTIGVCLDLFSRFRDKDKK